MKKILTSLFLLASSFSYADYVINLPMEATNGGSLPANSIKFSDNVGEIPETPTEPESPTYANTSGTFGYNGINSSIVTGQSAPAYVNNTTVAYTLTTNKKLIIDSVDLSDATGAGADFSNATVTSQHCSGTGPYSCVINISGTEASGGWGDTDNGLGDNLSNGYGIDFDIAFNGRYQTN